MNKRQTITYKKAGVDIDEGDRFVDLIGPIVKKTFRPEVMTEIGLFGALFKLDIKKYKNPVLVSGTDGVGTKLKVAFMVDRHDTVGIDLVAMCVNDILTSGAEPLFFLDYFATGKLKPEKAAEVIKGIATGCREAQCALVGGETAEMPGFYDRGEYDLSGFAVGVVDQNEQFRLVLAEDLPKPKKNAEDKADFGENLRNAYDSHFAGLAPRCRLIASWS